MKFNPAVVNALPYTADALQKPAAKPVAPTEKESSTTEQQMRGFDHNVGELTLANQAKFLALQAKFLTLRQFIDSGDPHACRYVLQYLLEDKKLDHGDARFNTTAGAIVANTEGDADLNMQAMKSILRESNTVNVDLLRENENVNSDIIITELKSQLLAGKRAHQDTKLDNAKLELLKDSLEQQLADEKTSRETDAARYREDKRMDFQLTKYSIAVGAIAAITGGDADRKMQAMETIYRESNTVNVDLLRENENVNSDIIITELKQQLLAEQRAHQATKLELKDSLEQQLAEESSRKRSRGASSSFE